MIVGAVWGLRHLAILFTPQGGPPGPWRVAEHCYDQKPAR